MTLTDKTGSIFMTRALAFLIDLGILFPFGFLVGILLVQVLGAPITPFQT